MSEIIKRQNPTDPPVQAQIREALVSVEAICSDDVVEKLNLEPLETIGTVLAHPEGEWPRWTFQAPLPVLEFSEELLYVDGYMAARLLRALQEQRGELWFIFGAFRTLNGKRCHIVLPGPQVPACLAVVDWEILDWTKKEIHRF